MEKKKRELLEHCSDVNRVTQILQEYPSLLNDELNSFGMTILLRCSLSGFSDVVNYLLTFPNLQVNKSDKQGLNALHYANGFPECIRVLVNVPNIEINKKNKNGNTPLIYASSWGDTECVKLLLSHPKIDVNIKNDDGRNAVSICCTKWGAKLDQKPIIIDLIQLKSPEKAKQDLRFSCSSLSRIQEIFSYHPSLLNASLDDSGMTVLMRVVLSNHVDVLDYLLSLKHPSDPQRSWININQSDKNGLVALHYANGNVESMRLLLERSTIRLDVNAQNKFGDTPLHWSARWGEMECVKLLLSHPDIDVTIKNYDGKTAEEVCCYHIGQSVSQKSMIVTMLKRKAILIDLLPIEEKNRRTKQFTRQHQEQQGGTNKSSLLQMILLFHLSVIFAIIDRFIPGFLLVGYYRPMKRVIYRSLCLPPPSSEGEDDDEQKKER